MRLSAVELGEHETFDISFKGIWQDQNFRVSYLPRVILFKIGEKVIHTIDVSKESIKAKPEEPTLPKAEFLKVGNENNLTLIKYQLTWKEGVHDFTHVLNFIEAMNTSLIGDDILFSRKGLSHLLHDEQARSFLDLALLSEARNTGYVGSMCGRNIYSDAYFDKENRFANWDYAVVIHLDEKGTQTPSGR